SDVDPRWDRANLISPTYKLESLEYYISKAKDNRPEFRALEKEEKARFHLSEATSSLMYPQIFLAGRYKYSHSPHISDSSSSFISNPFNQNSGAVLIGLKFDLDLGVKSSKHAQEKAKWIQSDFKKVH